MRCSAKQKKPRNIESSFGKVKSSGLTCTQPTEVEMHIRASRGLVLSFSINQYTLVQGNGAEGTPGCVLLLDDVQV